MRSENLLIDTYIRQLCTISFSQIGAFLFYLIYNLPELEEVNRK